MSPDDWRAIGLSIQTASLATLTIVVLGTPIAWTLARLRFPGKSALAAILTLPLALPPTVLGYVLLIVFSRRGWVGGWLEGQFGLIIVFHWPGAVIAATAAAFPLFLIPARAAFEGVDPNLENAARLLGAKESRVFLQVTLPLAWRGLAAGGLLAFIRALGDFGATLMILGNSPGPNQTASLAIYNAVQEGDSARALGLSLAVSLLALAVLIVAQRTQRL